MSKLHPREATPPEIVIPAKAGIQEGRTFQANATPVFTAVSGMAAIGYLVGDRRNRSGHWVLLSWMRLKMFALSLYSAALTAS